MKKSLHNSINNDSTSLTPLNTTPIKPDFFPGSIFNPRNITLNKGSQNLSGSDKNEAIKQDVTNSMFSGNPPTK